MQQEINFFMIEIDVTTYRREELIDITGNIAGVVKEQKWEDGILTLFVPHTTAAITINEHADPDVNRDIVTCLSSLIPVNKNFMHIEGNSDAHIKASLLGNSLTLIIEGGRIKLGTWQGIFFCEFDGPRNRKLWLKFI